MENPDHRHGRGKQSSQSVPLFSFNFSSQNLGNDSGDWLPLPPPSSCWGQGQPTFSDVHELLNIVCIKVVNVTITKAKPVT